MAESSKHLTGLDKNLLGAKIESGKESKRKRKRSKKQPARAQSNETLESQSKHHESLACVQQKVVDNNEDSKLNTEGTSQTVSASDTSGTTNISKAFNPPDNEKMTKEETTQGHGDLEECMNKDVQKDLKTIQEQGNGKGGSKYEQDTQDHASNSKFSKFAFHRTKKVKISTKKSSVDEDKQTSDPSGETTAVKIVTVDRNSKSPEKQVYKPGEAKLETSPSSADNENEDASKSPEGIQEKPQSKNNKGKKLKQLANFGRNKKKYETAFKLDETSNETNEGNLVDTPGRFQRSESTSSKPFQNTEIVGNESKEPVAAASSDFNNENTNDGKDEGTEIEKKRGGKQKKKGPVLGFKRSKSQPKTKASNSEDKQTTEGNPSKESDDFSAGTKSGPVGENKARFEERNEDSTANKSEAADLKTEEPSGAAAEMTKKISDQEETKSVESKEIVPPAPDQDSNQVTPKERKRENILRRRLRKLKSPGNILQSRKKLHGEDENSVEGTGVKTAEQVDKRASSELEPTAEEQTTVAEDTNDEKECSNNEGTSQAVKRKTSDLKTTTRALKKKKEDGENILEVEFNEELSETALAIIEEKDDRNIYEEVDVLSDLKSFKEIKDLTEVKEQSVDEVNKEMSQRKNVMEKLEEKKQTKVDEEISSSSLVRDDTKTEEVSKEARRKNQKLMQTVIKELTELNKKKEENKDAENEIQVEEREERANFSDRENAVSENQQLTSALDDNGLEQEPEEESYDSDITVVTVKTLSSHESLVEHKTEPDTEDEEIRAIAEEVPLAESETSSGTESLVENESKPDTKDEVRAVAEEVTLATKTPQVTETWENDETQPNTEDKEIGAIPEVISKESESMEPNMEIEERPAISEDESSEAEAPRESESSVRENETKQETEEGEIKRFTEEVSSGVDTSTAGNEDSQVHVPEAEAWAERAEHKTDPGSEPEEIHDINEAGETSQTEHNQEDSIEAVNINPEELVPESRAEHNTKPATEGEDLKDFTDAGKSSLKFKGQMVQVKVLNESEVSLNSDELETITKANKEDERKEEQDEDVGQNKEVESYQATSSQNSVEEWTMVHRVDLTDEISSQIKHSLVFNSLRRSYTSCCTIM